MPVRPPPKPALIVALVLSLACSVATSGAAQGPPTAAAQESPASDSPTLAEGYAHLRAGRVDEAVDTLRAVVHAKPDDGTAWALLGFALHSQGRYDEALPCHERAAALPGSESMGAYNAGLAHARLGDVDAAFTWLTRARSTGGIDMSKLLTDPDAEPLRDDPRFASLIPRADEPFAEGARVLFAWQGDAPGGEFGWIARDCGDVDGDGLHDVVTSAPSLAVDGPLAGRVYVYSTGSGERLWVRSGRPGDRFGAGVEAAGDVDGDGVPDVIGGAPGGDYALVMSGDDGRVLLRLDGPQRGAGFGRKSCDLGDVDGDGHADVLVGAPDHDGDQQDEGRAYVFSGADGALLHTFAGQGAGEKLGSAIAGAVDEGGTLIVVGAPGAGEQAEGRVDVYRGLTDEPAFSIRADAGGSQLGAMFVSVVGDVDADGQDDVYASDWAHAGNTGRVYVHSGATGERLLVLSGERRGEGFGTCPADLRADLDGDGHDDLVVGAWQYGQAAASGGRVTIYSGADGAVLHRWTGQLPGETFGFDATGLGDLDGDGVVDVLLTSAWSPVGGPKTGRVWVLAGPPRGAVDAPAETDAGG